MTNFESLSRSQRLRAALHRDVRAMCAESCHFLGLEITKSAMEVISELVYKKINLYGLDLENFAKHAKRSTINSDDVKLLVRRNPSLKSHLNSIVPASNQAVKEKKRKTLPTVKQTETPSKSKEETPPKENVSPKCDEDKPSKLDEVEDMMVDDTIDLTFD